MIMMSWHNQAIQLAKQFSRDGVTEMPKAIETTGTAIWPIGEGAKSLSEVPTNILPGGGVGN